MKDIADSDSPTAPPRRACSTSPTRPPTRPSAPLLLADHPARAGPGRPADQDADELLEDLADAGLAAGARGAGPARRGPPRARPLLRGQADATSTCRSTGG